MLRLVTRPSSHHFPYDFRQPRRVRDHHPAAAVLRGDVRRVAARHRPAVRGVLALSAAGGAGARRSVGSLRPPADSDLQPGRHGRQLRDAGARPQRRDAVRRAHRRRPVRRQHLHRARLRRRHHRAEGSRARLRHHRRGVRTRLHFRPGAQRHPVEHQLHRADLGRGRAHGDRDGDGVAVAAGNGASRAGRHRQSVQLPAVADAAARRPPRFSRSISSTGWRSRRSRRRSRCSWRGGSGSACRRPAISSPPSACSARSFRAVSSGRS